MKKKHLLWMAALFAITNISITRAAETVDFDTVQKAAYVSMLLSTNLRDSRLAATAIRKFYPTDTLMTDLVAEQLAHVTAVQPDPHAIRMINTYIDTLSHTDGGRYRTLLLRTRQNVQVSAVVKHIDESLPLMNKPSGPDFMRGQTDIEQQRASAEQILSSDVRTDRSQFKLISQGMRFEDVLKTLGTPDLIHSRGHRIQLLELNYRNAGLVVLGVEYSGSPTWVVNYAEAEWMPVSDYYDGKNFDVAQNLIGLNGRALAQYYKTEARRINGETSLVCLYLRRIDKQSNRPDPYETTMAKNALRHLTVASHPCAEDTLKRMVKSGYDDLAVLAKKSLVQREQWIAQGKPLKGQSAPIDVKDDEQGGDMDDEDDDDGKTSEK